MDSVTQIKAHVLNSIEGSVFFRELCAGTLPHQTLNQVLGQYYFWRDTVHKLALGLCIDNNRPLDGRGEATAILLAATVRRNRYRRFLASMGVELRKLGIAPPTMAYLDAFRARLGRGDLPRFNAALAGCELFSTIGSDFIRIALHSRYGVEDIAFWAIEDEEAHIRRMWTPLTELGADESTLVSAAMDEIEQHVILWDELRDYSVARAA